MNDSNIHINVQLDDEKIPREINWSASGSTTEEDQKAKAVFLAFWDGIEKSALRIDLWTKDMMVDEMADFYYQIFMTMADTFHRATKYEELSRQVKEFAKIFHENFVKLEASKNETGR